MQQALNDANRSYEVQRRLHYAKRPGFRIAEMQIGPAQCVPWHHHNCVQDTLYVISGKVRVATRNPDEEVCLDVGETYAVRPGRPHRVTNAGDDSAVFLVLQLGEYDFVQVS